MENTNQETVAHRDEPKFEPWLGIVFASCVPVLLMLVLPRSFAPYLFALTGILFVAGTVLLFVQQRGARHARRGVAAEGS